MKIRTGFVSNSSTSSFCIYGIILDMDKAIEKFDLKNKSERGEFKTELDWNKPNLYDVTDALEELFNESSIKIELGDTEYDTNIYIGIDLQSKSFDQFDESKTIGQIKKEIKEIIKAKSKMTDEEILLDTHSEAWIDN